MGQTRPLPDPADGFYEWKKIGPKKKQAYNISMKMTGCSLSSGW